MSPDARLGEFFSPFVSAPLDRQQAVAGREPQSPLRQAPADARTGRDGVDAEATHALGSDLIPDDT